MKILIPGGTGLLGTPLSAELARQGHQVWVLSRNPGRTAAPAGVALAQWDARTPQGWEALVEEADAIVNLAGENIGAGRWTAERKERILQSRVEAGQAITAAVRAARHKPAVLIQASGIGAYGARGDEWLDEATAPVSDFQAGICADWEASTREVEEAGLRRVVVRTGLVMTRSGGWMAPLTLAFRLFAGGPFGSGRQWWSWVHLDDYIRGIIYFLEQGSTKGVYNLAAPEPARMAEFGRELAKVLHRPYWLPTPAFAMRLLLGEMSVLVLEGQRVSSQRLLTSGFAYQYPLLRPALENLFGSATDL